MNGKTFLNALLKILLSPCIVGVHLWLQHEESTADSDNVDTL